MAIVEMSFEAVYTQHGTEVILLAELAIALKEGRSDKSKQTPFFFLSLNTIFGHNDSTPSSSLKCKTRATRSRLSYVLIQILSLQLTDSSRF